MVEMNVAKKIDYTARAKRAWQTRRANLRKKRGRPKKEVSLAMADLKVVTGKKIDFTARAKRAWLTRRSNLQAKKRDDRLSFGDFELSSSVFSFDQIRELKAAAVTIDGSSYHLLRKNGNLVPASYFQS